MEYRRREGSDTWHWRRDCHNWPKKGYTRSPRKPSSGELDNECKAKDRRDRKK